MYDKLTQSFLLEKAKQRAEEKKLGNKQEPVFEFDFKKLRQMRKYYKENQDV